MIRISTKIKRYIAIETFQHSEKLIKIRQQYLELSAKLAQIPPPLSRNAKNAFKKYSCIPVRIVIWIVTNI